MSRKTPGPVPSAAPKAPGVVSRRSVLGWVLAAPTLVVAARLGLDGVTAAPAAAATPGAGSSALGPVIRSSPQPFDEYDLSDFLSDSCRPTNNLLTIAIDKTGAATFALPRAEVGQGITTSMAMIIAEELDLPLSKVHVTLADANPELLYNQFTAGSNSTHSLYEPLRTAAAAARGQLSAAARVPGAWNPAQCARRMDRCTPRTDAPSTTARSPRRRPRPPTTRSSSS